MRLISGLLRTLGVMAIVLAVAGLLFTCVSIYWVAAGTVDQLAVELNAPYAHTSFYTLASICLVFYAAILMCGIQFARLRANLWWLFATALGLEIALQSVVGRLWLDPTIGQSVAAATGIALGGQTYQFLLGFPYWAPFIPLAVLLLQRRYAL